MLMKTLLRRVLLLVALLSGTSAEALVRGSSVTPAPPSPGGNGGGMLVGLGQPAYYLNGSPLLNWVSANGGSGVTEINLVAGGRQDLSTTYANGQIDINGSLIAGAGLSTISSIALGIFTPPPTAQYVPQLSGPSPWWNGLAMKVTWTGTSTVTMTGSLGTGGTALSCAGNSCTFTFGLDPNNVSLTFAITNVNDPPKNMFVYKAAYQAQVTALATCTPNVNCNHFAPDWLAEISAFGRLRSMDWMATNSSGVVDDTQLADFDYRLCIACDSGGGGYGSAGISGTTLTILPQTLVNQSYVQAGTLVKGVGVSAGTKILSQLTGTPGLDGTFLINNSQTLAPGSTVYFNADSGTNFISNKTGPKGGVHPSVMVELARITGADIYFTLPVAISDAGMTAIATYFRDHMPAGQKVFYQLGNENWNGALGITYWWLNGAAVPIFGGSFSGLVYNGYRAAQLMTIVKGVYGTNSYNKVTNPTGKWVGIIEGQEDNQNAASAAFMSGYSTWLAGCSCSTVVTDLFGEVITASYFFDFPATNDIQSITPGNPTIINSTGSSVSTGQIVRTFVGADGATPLNNLNFTATAINANSFSIPINTTGSTYSGTMYFGNSRYYNMMDASSACFASSSASGTGTISGNTLTLTGISGTVVLGQGVAGAGVPANTYINSGSAGSYTTNNSATVGPVAMTTTPCATKYQFFAQQNSKFLITGNNDFGYTGNGAGPLPGFPAIFTSNALAAHSLGMELTQYEGTNHVVAIGRMDPEFPINYQWDAAGNDPLYTPAKIYQTSFQMFRDYAQSAFSAKFLDQHQADWFSGLRFYGDTNPAWTATLAENALGPYVDPPSPPAWTASYAGNASNRLVEPGGGCGATCTDTLSAAVIGTAATSVKFLATITGGTLTSAACDGVTATVSDVVATIGGRPTAIYTIAVGAGSNTRSCTLVSTGASFQYRSFYIVPVTGLSSPTPSATGTFTGGNTAVTYAKNSLLLSISACGGSYSGSTGMGSTGVNANAVTVFSSIDTVNNTSEMIGLRWPYTSVRTGGFGGYQVAAGCNQDGVAAVYNFLLKRDLDPASNDNDPMWLEKAA